MAHTGDRFEMPDGSVYEVIGAAADNGGLFVEMQFTLPAGSVSPPPHVHARMTEGYDAIDGAFDVLSDGAGPALGPDNPRRSRPRR